MTLEEAIDIANQRADRQYWGGKSIITWYVFKWNDGYIIRTQADVDRNQLTDWVYNTKTREIRYI